MEHSQFGEIVEQYEKLVYTICYQFTRDHHTAQDLAQETFLSAYRHIDGCDPEGYKPWLARIAANKARDHLRSAYNRKVTPPGENGLPEDGNVLFIQPQQPEDITLEKDSVRRIAEDILALKEPYHHVAVLYFLEECSVEEIAKRLDRPPKTVHTQLYRARKMLQQKLQTPATTRKGGP